MVHTCSRTPILLPTGTCPLINKCRLEHLLIIFYCKNLLYFMSLIHIEITYDKKTAETTLYFVFFVILLVRLLSSPAQLVSKNKEQIFIWFVLHFNFFCCFRSLTKMTMRRRHDTMTNNNNSIIDRRVLTTILTKNIKIALKKKQTMECQKRCSICMYLYFKNGDKKVVCNNNRFSFAVLNFSCLDSVKSLTYQVVSQVSVCILHC